MATVVFCRHCAKERGWRIPSVRVTTDPCDICGGHDQIGERRIHPRTRREVVKYKDLKNFEHDARFLPGTRQEAKLQKAFVDQEQ